MLLGARPSAASRIKDFIVVHLQPTSRSVLILAAGLTAKRFLFSFLSSPGQTTQRLQPNANVEGLWKSEADSGLRKTLHRGHLDFSIQTSGNGSVFSQKSFLALGSCHQSRLCCLPFSAQHLCRELDCYLRTPQLSSVELLRSCAEGRPLSRQQEPMLLGRGRIHSSGGPKQPKGPRNPGRCHGSA